MKPKHKSSIKLYPVDASSSIPLPYADEGIKAGFPSPAQDYMELSIDLNKELIKHPASTFYGRVSGLSLQDACIEDGDILVVDKSLIPRNRDLAVCFIDGEFTLKYVQMENGEVWLLPANPAYQPLQVTEDNTFLIWGVVTYTIRDQRNIHKKKR